MALAARPSKGAHLVRTFTGSNATPVDPDAVQAAKESYENKAPMELVYATEKEAKSTLTKLRTHLNAEGKGLRAKIVQDGETFVIELTVSAKRTVDDSDEAVQKRLAKAETEEERQAILARVAERASKAASPQIV